LTTFCPKEILEEIRNRASIVGVISEYVSLKKAGKNYQGLCPFHNEKTPSFTVSEEKQVFYCFGCQKGGDVITFFREINNLSFIEAVTELGRRYGVSLPAFEQSTAKKQGESESFLSINESACAYFHSVLMKLPEGQPGREYLKKRGVAPEMWKAFSLGYSAERWDGLVSYLKVKKIPLEAAKSVGLVSSRKSGGYFDYFRGRILFPITSLSGRPIGFGGRTVGGSSPKYLNSPDSVIYRKAQSLFGLSVTREAIVREDRVVIVEGYFDLVSLYQAGIKTVVSPLGTALTSSQIRILKRFTSNIVMLFDGDEAGEKAVLRSLELFLAEGLLPRVVIMPSGLDPDECVRQKGRLYFENEIAQAPLLLNYFISKAIDKTDILRPLGKSAVVEKVMPILNAIHDPIVQDEYIRELAERLSVREDHIRQFIQNDSLSRGRKEFRYPEEDRREEFLLALVLRKPCLLTAMDQSDVLKDFINPRFRSLGAALITMYKQDGKVDVTRLIDIVGEKQGALITELTLREDTLEDSDEGFSDCIRQIKRSRIKKMKMELTKQIRKAQENHNESEIRALNRKKALLIDQERNLN